MKNIVIALVSLTVVSSAFAQQRETVQALSAGQNKNLQQQQFGDGYVPKGKQGRVSEGTNLRVVYGMASMTEVSPTALTLLVPASIASNGTPMLLKVNPSVKDQARIVRASHVRMTVTKSPINPMQVDFLGVDQQEVAVKLEVKSNGDLTLVPTVQLEAGEYTLAFENTISKQLESSNWDFRVK